MHKTENFFETNIKTKALIGTSKKICEYQEKTNVNESSIPSVRLPQRFSAPDHLINAFNSLTDESPPIIGTKRYKLSFDPHVPLNDDELFYITNESMKSFWTIQRIKEMTDIILHKTKITLSLLDWLCTNYSKNNAVRWTIDNNETENFYLYEK